MAELLFKQIKQPKTRWTFYYTYAKVKSVKYKINNRNSRLKKTSNKKRLLVGACVIGIAICLIAGLELTNKINILGEKQPTNGSETTTIPEQNASEPEPTNTQDKEQTEKVASGNPKDESNQTNLSQPTNPTSTKKSVTPVITYANNNPGDNRVFGYVSGVVESSGTCTFTFTGNGTITKPTTGVEDVSKTNCSTTPPAGNGWSVVLSYSSNTASGKSQKVPVD